MSDPAAPGACPDTPGALPVGTRLGEFELRDVIGVGGFGIVYRAFDHALEREVAIKEYMPASLAARGGSAQVAPVSPSAAGNFELGLRSFVDEGRILARFDSPSLPKVHRFWEANGTAYIAMPLYRGRTLEEVRAAMPAPPGEAASRALLMPLLAAVDLLHRESIYCREIAPDNMLVEADNRPMLLDFGTARRVIGGKSQVSTAILNPAYAPIEQYAEAASVKQGPWTDLYALGAAMYFLLLGQAPPASTARAVVDDMQPLAERGVQGCSKPFLHAIDWMLAPWPADRPQNVAALVEVLEGRAAVPSRTLEPGSVASVPAGAEAAVGASRVPRPQAVDMAATPGTRTVVPPAPAARPAPPPPAGSPDPRSTALPSNALMRLALPLVLLLVAAAWWFWPKPAGHEAAPTQPPAGRVVPAPVPLMAAPQAPMPAAAPAPAPAPVTTNVAPTPGSKASLGSPAAAAAETARAVVPAPAKPKVAESARPADPPASAPRPKAVIATAPAPAPKAEPLPTPAATPATRPADAVPAGRPAGTAAPAPVPAAAAPAPLVAMPLPASTAPVAKGPREQCGRRVFIALLNCMTRECAKPGNRALPECALYRPPD